MTKTYPRIFAGALALLLSSGARAQDGAQPSGPAPDEAPPTPAPTAPPPPPSSAPAQAAPPEGAAPMRIEVPADANHESPPGQWVSTAQYGWVWLPFNSAYTYAPVDSGGDPYTYAYYPGYGWQWMASPWMFGIGPQPWFGSYGYAHYGWYGHGWYGHSWYGYRSGYPGGYHGVVYSHVGAWGGRGGVGVNVHTNGGVHETVRAAAPRAAIAHANPRPAAHANPRPAAHANPRPAAHANPRPAAHANPRPAAREPVEEHAAPAAHGGGHGGGHHR